MTRYFNERVLCPHCNRQHTVETGFGRWMRAHPELDSRDGQTIYDCDYINHRYMVDHNRECQYIMLIEIKTFNAKPHVAQRDTLALIGQFLRNDRKTSFKKNRLSMSGRPFKAWSTLNKKQITVRAFGSHLLIFERNDPTDGRIWWDYKEIDEYQLIKLLRFEIHPETLNPMDLRIHHRKHETQSLFT